MEAALDFGKTILMFMNFNPKGMTVLHSMCNIKTIPPLSQALTSWFFGNTNINLIKITLKGF